MNALERTVHDFNVRTAAKIELLEFLSEVAQETNGAKVWEALFNEIRAGLVEALAAQKDPE